MVLKFVETEMLGSGDEAEAIATLNNFFSRYIIPQNAWYLPAIIIIITAVLVKRLLRRRRCLMKSAQR